MDYILFISFFNLTNNNLTKFNYVSSSIANFILAFFLWLKLCSMDRCYCVSNDFMSISHKGDSL